MLVFVFSVLRFSDFWILYCVFCFIVSLFSEVRFRVFGRLRFLCFRDAVLWGRLMFMVSASLFCIFL